MVQFSERLSTVPFRMTKSIYLSDAGRCQMGQSQFGVQTEDRTSGTMNRSGNRIASRPAQPKTNQCLQNAPRDDLHNTAAAPALQAVKQ